MQCRKKSKSARRYSPQMAFTLVELLVVIGVIVILISLLLPSISAARSQSRAVQCTANLRQLGIGLLQYAMDNHGNFPENVVSPTPQYWFNFTNGYLPPMPANGVGSSIYVCPEDQSAALSYSMNIWASNKVDKVVLSLAPPDCVLWPHVRRPSELILFAESWSYEGNATTGWQAQPTIGDKGTTAGQRFGALGGVTPFSAGRWGFVNCELAFNRHRHVGGYGTQPVGLVGICFDDGHVAVCSNDDLVNEASGMSTGLAAWTTIDYMK
jgi:type II secretory pathway pseudopilin PulG